MIVRILRDLASEKRFSMEKYADKLIKFLKLTDEVKTEEITPELVKVPEIFYKLPKFNKIINYYTRFIDYPGKLKKHNADIFHIIDHGYSNLAFNLHRDNKKIIITCHDLIPLKDEKITSMSKIALASFKYSIKGLKKVDKIIADSESTRKDIVNYLSIGENKIKVIYLGVDEAFKEIDDKDILESFKNKYAIPDSKKLLHVGVNYSYKNIEGILKSLDILNNEMKMNISLLKVGTDFTELQKNIIKESGLSKKVLYLGILSEEEMPLVYNIADILVYPSFYEGFCFPVLEAFASSLPVITSCVGSIPEVTGDDAIFVNPYDEFELANTIKKVLDDETLRQSLKIKGLNRSKLFTWQKTASETFKVYREVYRK